ncbi:MAG: cation:proton antiporter [Myxococcales bacterium]|nr:cation:proton antiporter [Myxococcales bacterium]
MIDSLWQVASFALAFGLISLASDRIGLWVRRWQMPLITGFLGTGVLAGPYVLELITSETVRNLGFIDQISLAIIALAAGNELYLKEIKNRLRAIAWITVAQLLTTSTLSALAVFLLADIIPFMADISTAGRIGISLLAGAILVARSPSSAIAVVNELRAKGPFTKTTLGVTVVMDIVVIILFAIAFSIAGSLLSNRPFSGGSVAILLAEIGASIGLGCAVGWVIDRMLRWVDGEMLRKAFILAIGYGVFIGSHGLRDWSAASMGHAVHLEALLICMVASFWVTNFSESRESLTHLLERLCPPIYVAFFTLTGASLELDVLPDTWHIAVTFFLVRLFGIWAGNHLGGRACGEPALHNRIGWMAHVAQAGVALGLAKNVADAFPGWGGSFATTIIALIVLNQLVGPPFMKWAIALAGEDRSRADPAEFDGVRDAILFGVEGQTLALARTLAGAGWTVKMACLESRTKRAIGDLDIWVHPIDNLDLATLDALDASHADAIVGMMDDAENLALCELAFTRYGTKVMVVRLQDRSYHDRFTELGVTIIDPRSAVVGLLDRAVRSPTSAALLLGMEEGQDMIDVDVGDPDLFGLAVRELRLPLDVAVLYVHREGSMIPSKGTTTLHSGDRVTLTGPVQALELAALKLEG